MLQEMRTAVSSFWIKLLLAALVVSFVSFYGFRGDREFSPGIVAKVNGESIRERDVAIRFQNMIEYYRRMGMIQNDLPEALMGTMRHQVIAQMIDERIQASEAERVGLRVAPAELRTSIEKQFSDAKGAFDFEFYRNYLRNRLGKSPGDFEKDQARSLLARDYDRLLRLTAHTSTEELRLLYRARNEKASLAFVRIDPDRPPRNFRRPSPPSERDLASHLETHASEYRIPEARKIEVAWYDWTDFEKPLDAELSDLLIRKFPSESDPAVTGERLHAAHILLRISDGNEAEIRRRAERIHQKIRSGADFGQLARTESEDGSRSEGGDLGYFGKGAMVKEFEAKALSMKPGEISPPFRTPFGYHIVKLLGRIPAGPRSVERLKPELLWHWRKESLAKPGRLEHFMKEAEHLLLPLKGTPSGAGFSATPNEPRLRQTRSGFLSPDETIPGLPDGAEILKAAQALPAGGIGDPMRLPATGRVCLVRVIEVRPSRVPSLNEVRARVLDDLGKARMRDALAAYAKELLAKSISGGTPIDLLAKAEGLAVEETGDFARSNDDRVPKIGVSRIVMEKAFSATPAQPFLPEPVSSGNGTLLVALRKRSSPDWSLFESEKDALRSAAEEESSRKRVGEWTAFLRSKAKVEESGPAPGSPVDEL